MLRLRTTATLSLLAWLVGIAGTQWLSGLTDDWAGPRSRHPAIAATRPHPRTSQLHSRHRPPRVVDALPEPALAAAPSRENPALVPMSTPPDPAPWATLRGHLDGRVVLAIATDGAGRVSSARIAQSSGDPLLDAYALATVRRWRFAVPADSPDGVHGTLPVRFASAP